MQLGTIIDILKNAPADARVVFDFCGLVPTGKIDSWRGDYAELALGWKAMSWEDNPCLCGDLLAELRDAVGRSHYGYKGGEYVASERTEVWVDNYSEYTSAGIHKIEFDDDEVVISTQRNCFR